MCKLLQLLKNPRKPKLKYWPSKKHFHNMAHLFSLGLERHLILLLFRVFKPCFTNAALKTAFSLLLEGTFGFPDLFIHQFLLSIVHKPLFTSHTLAYQIYRSRREGKKPDLLFLAKGLDLHKLLSVGAPAPCYSQATPSLILEHQLIQLSASP